MKIKILLFFVLISSLAAQDMKRSYSLDAKNPPQAIGDLKVKTEFTSNCIISQPSIGIPRYKFVIDTKIPDCPLNLGVYQSDILRYVKQNFENGFLVAGSVAAVGIEIKDGRITWIESLEIEGTDPNLSILWKKVIDHSSIIHLEQRNSELVLNERYVVWYKINENFMGVNRLKNFVSSKGNIYISLL